MKKRPKGGEASSSREAADERFGGRLRGRGGEVSGGCLGGVWEGCGKGQGGVAPFHAARRRRKQRKRKMWSGVLSMKNWMYLPRATSGDLAGWSRAVSGGLGWSRYISGDLG